MSALKSMTVPKLLEEFKYQFWWWPTTCSTCSCDGCNNTARGGMWCRHCIYLELSSRTDVDTFAVQRLFELYKQKVDLEVDIQATVEQVMK